MIRPTARYRKTIVFALAVACILFASLAGNGGFAFFHGNSAKALRVPVPAPGFPHHGVIGEDGTDIQESTTISSDFTALEETTCPDPPLLPGYGRIHPSSPRFVESPHLPDIYHPPIV